MVSANADDLVYNSIGNFGRYQFFLVALLYLHRPPVGFHQIMVVLVSPPVGNFTCKEPANVTDPCSDACKSYEYDRSVWENTIVHEWDLVCNRKYIVSAVQSVIMSGILVGSVLFGYTADRFGRKPTVIICAILQVVAGSAAAFSPWLELYTALRWFATVAVGGSMMPCFAILMEFTPKKYRTTIGMFFTVPVYVGHALLGPIGYVSRRWDHIQLIICVPALILLIDICLLPESPRWLMNMKKNERIIKQFECAAKFNKMPTEQIKADVEAVAATYTATKGGNAIKMFQTARMRTKSIILFINWMNVSLVYYALTQFTGTIGGNVFVNITVAGCVQIPGAILGVILISRIGRKWSLVTSYMMNSIPLIAMCFVPEKPDWPTQVLSMIAMCGMAMAFCLIYVYSGELMPTEIRTVSMGICSMFARIGSMISPFILNAADAGRWIPPVIVALFPIICSLLVMFFLPDTLNKPLADTVEEADQL